MPEPITLRLPSTVKPFPSDFVPPTPEYLTGTWHVTHSTLPLWKSKRNVNLTYTQLSPSSSGLSRLDDVASYQTLSSDKIQTIHGIDKASPGGWDWRGTGWLKVASSHWEILGYGELDGGDRWAVSYFAKTMFTPAGIDVLSRKKEGVAADVLEAVKRALEELQDEGVRKLASGLFEVRRD